MTKQRQKRHVPTVGPYGFREDAPTLKAYLASGEYYRVYCKYCRRWHTHSPFEGHRLAHCDDPDSPYAPTGYNLVYAGEFTLAVWRRFSDVQS